MTNKQILGATIFEILLVLVIISTILLFSISQYIIYRQDAYVRQVQTNVDLLFDAMVKYFRAHCADPGNNLHGYYDSQFLPITLQDLINQGFLEVPNNQMPVNPIVNGNGVGQGYILQFNQVQDQTAPQRLPQRLYPGSGAWMGNIVLWRIQVAVEFKDTDTSIRYRKLLGANCFSTISANYVKPCSQAPADATQYAVWERLPSLASSQANSPFWLSKPVAKQFNQMYTTYPILLLTGFPDNTEFTSRQYFICGGQ